MFNQSGSRRWTHFHSALQLAVQRSAHKWTFEDFAECFPLYVEEDKNGASATFNSISDYIEAQNFRDLDKLFKDYNVQESIDILHRIVTDAKERKLKGVSRDDAWKEDLEPQTVVCARTIPVLEKEAKQLREALAQAEEENRRLYTKLQEHTTATDRTNEHVSQIFNKVDKALNESKLVPVDEIEEWTFRTTESLKFISQS